MRKLVVLLALAGALVSALPGAVAQDPPAEPQDEDPCSPWDISGVPPNEVSIHFDCAASNVAEFLPTPAAELFMCVFYTAWGPIGPIVSGAATQESQVPIRVDCIG